SAQLDPIFSAAKKTAADPQAAELVRIPAIELLGLTSYIDCNALLLSLLNLKEPQAVQLAAISTLARFTEPQVGRELAKRWDALTPRLRSEALTALLARSDRAQALLEAIQTGTIRPTVLDSTQTRFLRNHKDKEIHALAAKVLPAKPGST